MQSSQVGRRERARDECMERNLIVFFSLRLTHKRCEALISVFMVRREPHTPRARQYHSTPNTQNQLLRPECFNRICNQSCSTKVIPTRYVYAAANRSFIITKLWCVTVAFPLHIT